MCIRQKHLFNNDISKLLLSNERIDFCEFFKKKIKRINNVDTFSQHSLFIFIKGSDIFGHTCKNEYLTQLLVNRDLSYDDNVYHSGI